MLPPEIMLDQLQFEQKRLTQWLSDAQKRGITIFNGQFSAVLTDVCTYILALKRGQSVDFMTFMELQHQSDCAVFAYWEARDAQVEQDQRTAYYLSVRDRVHELQRKGLLERLEDGTYDLTDAGKDYFSL